MIASRGLSAITYWSAQLSSDITRGAATASAASASPAARAAAKRSAAVIRSVRDEAVEKAVEHHLAQLFGRRPGEGRLGQQQRHETMTGRPHRLSRAVDGAGAQAPRGADLAHHADEAVVAAIAEGLGLLLLDLAEHARGATEDQLVGVGVFQ